MDFTASLHLMLDDQPVGVHARRHSDRSEIYFIDLHAWAPNHAHLCLSGTAAQLTSALDRMREELARTLDRELAGTS